MAGFPLLLPFRHCLVHSFNHSVVVHTVIRRSFLPSITTTLSSPAYTRIHLHTCRPYYHGTTLRSHALPALAVCTGTIGTWWNYWNLVRRIPPVVKHPYSTSKFCGPYVGMVQGTPYNLDHSITCSITLTSMLVDQVILHLHQLSVVPSSSSKEPHITIRSPPFTTCHHLIPTN